MCHIFSLAPLPHPLTLCLPPSPLVPLISGPLTDGHYPNPPPSHLLPLLPGATCGRREGNLRGWRQGQVVSAHKYTDVHTHASTNTHCHIQWGQTHWDTVYIKSCSNPECIMRMVTDLVTSRSNQSLNLQILFIIYSNTHSLCVSVFLFLLLIHFLSHPLCRSR